MNKSKNTLESARLYLSAMPQFGAKPSGERLARMEQSTHFQDGKFQNPVPTKMNTGPADMWKDMKKYFGGNSNRTPGANLPVIQVDPQRASVSAEEIRVTWFGHSASWLEMEGKNILLDPMLGPVSSPFESMGSKRFFQQLPIEIEDMPFLDAVIFSHDHYDHLDYGSILNLKDKTGHFFTPLGVGAHLEAWGVPAENITELDWNESVDFGTLTLTTVPTRHFSGRGMTDSKRTQWCGWVLAGREQKVFFSGDSGYFEGFKRVGEQHGPFDLTLMECGQYGDSWPFIHMTPEETAQAHLDVKGKILLPIHWGGFSLSGHSWTDPIERLLAKAQEFNIQVTTPRIGEAVELGKPLPDSKWWSDH